MAWATAAETLAITGVAVTDEQVAVAQPIVELFAGTSAEADADQTPRTLRLLKYAVAYQTAWMKDQIDVTSRVDVASLSQDGVSMTPANDDAQFLAPLAARWLARLPWRRSRSVFTGGRAGVIRTGIEQARENVVYESDDDLDGRPWLPLYS